MTDGNQNLNTGVLKRRKEREGVDPPDYWGYSPPFCT